MSEGRKLLEEALDAIPMWRLQDEGSPEWRKAQAKKNFELRARIDAHLKTGGWISVEERLPEDTDTVLCVVFSDVCNAPIIQVAAYQFFHERRWGEYERENLRVTHWQPLPDLPEAK